MALLRCHRYCVEAMLGEIQECMNDSRSEVSNIPFESWNTEYSTVQLRRWRLQWPNVTRVSVWLSTTFMFVSYSFGVTLVLCCSAHLVFSSTRLISTSEGSIELKRIFCYGNQLSDEITKDRKSLSPFPLQILHWRGIGHNNARCASNFFSVARKTCYKYVQWYFPYWIGTQIYENAALINMTKRKVNCLVLSWSIVFKVDWSNCLYWRYRICQLTILLHSSSISA